MTLRLKPHAFVMSSTPGNDIAEAVCKALNDSGQATARSWKTEFKATELYEESLQRTVLQCDFGIAVVTPDDVTRIDRVGQKDEVYEPRDNVMFEIGMFRGALGRKHVLPVVVTRDGVKPSLPTDLGGLNSFTATVNKGAPVAGQVATVCGHLLAHMAQHHKKPGLGLLPSSALAIGYVENFIQRVARLLNDPGEFVRTAEPNKKLHVDSDKWTLSIYLPAKLSAAEGLAWKDTVKALKLIDAQVAQPGAPRPYPLWIKAPGPSGAVEFFDMPTTLKSVHDAIRLLMSEDKTTDDDFEIADERGTSDFHRAVERLVEKANLSAKVKVIGWDDLAARCAAP